MKDTTTKKRGGPQPGSGRPPKDLADKVVKCHISMTVAHHAATKGDRAGMIRRALDAALSKEIDYSITGIVNSVNFEPSMGGLVSRLTITFQARAVVYLWRHDGNISFKPGDRINVTMSNGKSTIEVLNQPTGANEK